MHIIADNMDGTNLEIFHTTFNIFIDVLLHMYVCAKGILQLFLNERNAIFKK
jgi:hypothetical protein